MTLAELITMPTTLDTGRARYHESLFRSYHILCRAVALLADGVEGEAVAQLITEMMEMPQTDLDRKEQ